MAVRITTPRYPERSRVPEREREHERTATPPRTATPAGPHLVARWRIYVLWILSLVLVGWIVVRLVEVQVLEQAYWSGMASAEINQQITLQPARGRVTDRFGHVLAMDVEKQSLWAMPPYLAEDKVAALSLTLAAILGKDSTEIQALLSDPAREYVRLARWLEPEVADRVAALGEPGLRLVYEPTRFYPQNELAAHLVGAVNHEGVGISGVEAFHNTTLRGITGTITAEFDPARNPITIAPHQTRPARNGSDVQLTIDPVIQHIAESELVQSIEQNSAEGGSVVVIEVATGAVRAMASWPTFNPNTYLDYPEEIYARNPAVSALYEPGSTFKMITVAAGLNTDAFTADTRVNDTGVIWRYDYNLKNWNSAPNGMITPGEVIYHSSNVGALLLNELTGSQAFYDTVYDFGFGAQTGVELGGEEQGIVHGYGTAFYNDLTLLTNAYGQGISVTPLQMTNAAAAIANDGQLMRPYIVEQICTDGKCIATEPQPVRQVIDPGVAWTVRRMLVGSANHYAPVVWAGQTANWGDQWLVPGYQVGAKTGTSSIPLPGGGYDSTATIGSVLGFAPAEDAKYAVLVKVDRPADIWGVRTAIPLFHTIVDQILDYERVPPDPQLYSPGQQ